jgi:hypothetical protein
MARPTDPQQPRRMDTTAQDVSIPGASESILCAKCDKPIPTGESHAVWLNFDGRPHEHFHDACFSSPAALRDPRESESLIIKQFPEIIGDGLTACMRERTAHSSVEKEMDDWIRRLSSNKFERNKQLQLAREQIETARLAIEAFYGRFRTLATTAKN